jgi:hypothetical protein
VFARILKAVETTKQNGARRKKPHRPKPEEKEYK